MIYLLLAIVALAGGTARGVRLGAALLPLQGS